MMNGEVVSWLLRVIAIGVACLLGYKLMVLFKKKRSEKVEQE